MIRRLAALVFAAALAVSAAAASLTAPKPTPPGTGAPAGDAVAVCAAFKDGDYSTLTDAPTLLVNSVAQAATGELPALCLVNGRIAPTIGFRMWLPLGTWNGKLAQGGCGGRCGDILDDGCQIVVARGYACLAADMGHKGTFYDDLWAIDNVPGEIDFGFRSTHVANIAARALTEAFYGKKPRWVYYFGASTGGRQGLVSAQRFPGDFDGIIAGEPAMGTPGTAQAEVGPALRRAVASLYDDAGKPLVSPAEIQRVHDAALARCDMDDNLQDGFISDPRRCGFRPAQLQCKTAGDSGCLTLRQVAALDGVYAAGAMPGSERGWIGAYVGKDGGTGRYVRRMKNTYKYPYAWIFNDATNPDLRPFKARGGKLILYQGWADEATFPGNPPAYYETVERLMGGRAETQDFFRLFMIPGQSHIPGNGGAETIDYLSHLEAWVERGEAPDVLLAQKMKRLARFAGPVTYAEFLTPENVEFARPVYPYPVQAKFSGRGDPKSADSWRPAGSR